MKKVLIISIISVLLTLLSPFFFSAYVTKPPTETTTSLSFGGPIPFAVQETKLPSNKKEFPLKREFQSPTEVNTDFRLLPFFFSCLLFFLILFSLFHIFARFFSKKQK